MFNQAVEKLVALALAEDVGSGDVTSHATIPSEQRGSAYLLARQDLLFCSHDFVDFLCGISQGGISQAEEPRFFSSEIHYTPSSRQSGWYRDGEEIGSLSGSVRDLLTLERTLLNFVQRLSGIASRSKTTQDLLLSTGITLLDTRKTTPGWRELEKYAVAFGGATNHRHGLFDAFLIKNNHIDAVGGDIRTAIRLCREANSSLTLEVEVRSVDELRLALEESPDWILLDNMNPAQLAEAVRIVGELRPGADRPKLEASGGYTPENVGRILNTGVDAVSMGWLTHSAPAADISLRFRK